MGPLPAFFFASGLHAVHHMPYYVCLPCGVTRREHDGRPVRAGTTPTYTRNVASRPVTGRIANVGARGSRQLYRTTGTELKTTRTDNALRSHDGMGRSRTQAGKRSPLHVR